MEESKTASTLRNDDTLSFGVTRMSMYNNNGNRPLQNTGLTPLPDRDF
jgi:hypothetical protein